MLRRVIALEKKMLSCFSVEKQLSFLSYSYLNDIVSLKYWLSFVIKMKRKEPSVRTGFIAVRT
jgi:hypothetical protein